MSLLGKLKKARDAATAPTQSAVVAARAPITDPYRHYAQLFDISAAFRAGDWPRAKGLLDGLPSAQSRFAATQILCQSAALDPVLERVRQADPADVDAAALWGARAIVQGHLRAADEVLTDVLRRDPGHLIAAGWRLLSVRSPDHAADELLRRYEQLERHHPRIVAAQFHVLLGLLPTGGGTWNEATAFVDRITATAPDGSYSHVLVAVLHIEAWRARIIPSLGEKSIQADIARAAEASMFHPAYRRGIGWVWVNNTFAFAFGQGANADYAPRAFASLNNQMSERPWSYLPDPEPSFVALREWAARLGAARARKGD